MNPKEQAVWIQVALLLSGIGVNLMNSLKALIAAAHPGKSPEEIGATCDVILADARVRATLARQAAGGA